jgi:hypothetical protein
LTGVMDRYDGTHKQPPWQFQPENVEARVFLATCQMMGLFEFKQQQRDGKPCSAHDIARAVLVDVDKFEMFSKGLLQLATASPDEQRRMLGIDPGTISTDQMVAAMRKIVGDDGIVMVRDQGGSET